MYLSAEEITWPEITAFLGLQRGRLQLQRRVAWVALTAERHLHKTLLPFMNQQRVPGVLL